MKNIRELLIRARKITPPDETVRKMVCEIVKEKLGVSLEISATRMHNGIFYIQSRGALKSELFMKKREILAECRKTLGKTCPSDIR